MQSSIVPYLRCPVCHSPLRLEARSTSGSSVNSGTLACRTCKARFPVFHGRPILITSDSVCKWTAPIDEIFGRRRLKMAPGPLSIDRLARMGDKQAIERAKSVLPLRVHGSMPIHKEEDLLRSLRAVESKAKYRMWGNWLFTRKREQAFLDHLREPGDAMEVFIETVHQENPRSLLDILSGGGSAVSSLVNASDGIEHAFALDRDLKCLWSIQRKFMYLGRSNHCEAVGGDVRRLPFTSDGISVVTSVMGLQEVYAVSMMLREAARVLCPGGCFVMMYEPRPDTYGMMSVAGYNRFARAVDMFSGHGDLMKLAEESGFNVECTTIISSEGEDYRLTLLRKPR